MSGHQPTVSVLIPTRNGAAFIREAIRSVLGQTFGDFELIIVDDGSTDKTVAISREMRDSRIRIVANTLNRGLSANWNQCLREARGAYIKLLPQDDLLAPDCLAVQVNQLNDDPRQRLALAFSARTIIGPSGRALLRRRWGSKDCVIKREDVLTRTCRLGTNPIGEPGAVLFRRSASLKAGNFDERWQFPIDIAYWLRLLEQGEAAFSPRELASFRVSPTSHSVRMGIRQGLEFAEFIGDLGTRNHRDLHGALIGTGKAMSVVNAIGRLAVYNLTLGWGRPPGASHVKP